jgi:hypothetical protein
MEVAYCSGKEIRSVAFSKSPTGGPAMNPLQKTMLSSAVLAAVTVGAPGAARADAFAQSILVIDNFRLLHANGTTYPGAAAPAAALPTSTWPAR